MNKKLEWHFSGPYSKGEGLSITTPCLYCDICIDLLIIGVNIFGFVAWVAISDEIETFEAHENDGQTA